MLVIEATGRKVNDAIAAGLAQVGKSLSDVEVEIIDHGGIFRKAKVRITVEGEEPPAPVRETKDENRIIIPSKSEREKNRNSFGDKKRRDDRRNEEKADKPQKTEKHEKEISRSETVKERKPLEKKTESVSDDKKAEKEKQIKEPRKGAPITAEVSEKAVNFVKELVVKMGIEAEVLSTVEDNELHIEIKTDNGAVIGYHGEVLNSIEYLVSYSLNRDSENYYRVIVDSNGYREKRKGTLEDIAKRMAAKCIRTHHKVSLDPMNSSERKIIHSALSDNEQIITRSEGHEPNRYVIIFYKRNK